MIGKSDGCSDGRTGAVSDLVAMATAITISDDNCVKYHFLLLAMGAFWGRMRVFWTLLLWNYGRRCWSGLYLSTCLPFYQRSLSGQAAGDAPIKATSAISSAYPIAWPPSLSSVVNYHGFYWPGKWPTDTVWTYRSAFAQAWSGIIYY